MNEKPCKLTTKAKEPAKQKNQRNIRRSSRIVVRFKLVVKYPFLGSNPGRVPMTYGTKQGNHESTLLLFLDSGPVHNTILTDIPLKRLVALKISVSLYDRQIER